MQSESKILFDNREEDSAIRAILEGTSSATGTDFFSALVKNLCAILNTNGAWVTEYFEETRFLKALSFWYNDRWIRNFGYPIDNTPCQDVIDESKFVHIKENVSELFPDVPDLGIKVVSYMGAPLLNFDGKTLGLLGVIDDKPMPDEPNNEAIFHIFAARAAAELQRLNAEKEIEDKEKKLRRLVNSAMDGIIDLDYNFVIRMMNPAAEKLFHCELSNAVGNNFLNLLSEQGKNIFKNSINELQKLPEGEKYIWITDSLNIRCKNGAEFPAEATISQYEINGEIYFTVILRNINEKLEAEKKIHNLEVEAEYLKEEIKILNDFDEIIGQSRPIMNLLNEVNLVAKTDSTVLISGETGTGKELIARAIHSASKRKNKQLIKVNCSAIPASLIESEFFGHVPGAFTGATKTRIGRFQFADGGTIFLDEIGDLQLDLQSKLLRILQEGEFEPVGSSETKKVDVRVIAATNRNLKEEVKAGKFRQDLYYRLNVYPITVPPLRERGNDIIKLANEFILRCSRKLGKTPPRLTHESINKLISYHWPGNIRELQNVIERTVIISKNGKINLDKILQDDFELDDDAVKNEDSNKKIFSQEELLRIEKENIVRALDFTDWKISGKDGAAKLLGLPPTTLNSRLKALGIKKSKVVH
ncbi:MAG: sigma 54-interacting transcriptional regulator [Ignavibacteriaceae bacterium]